MTDTPKPTPDADTGVPPDATTEESKGLPHSDRERSETAPLQKPDSG